jgi:hypothetical protein
VKYSSASVVVLFLGVALAAGACHGNQPVAPAPAAAPLSPPVAAQADDRSAVCAQVAAGLHADPAQVTAALRADSNASLMTLAKPRGLAQDQLAELILAALRDRADARLRSRAWTAQQAEQDKQFWSAQPQPDLISEVSRWFREA